MKEVGDRDGLQNSPPLEEEKVSTFTIRGPPKVHRKTSGDPPFQRAKRQSDDETCLPSTKRFSLWTQSTKHHVIVIDDDDDTDDLEEKKDVVVEAKEDTKEDTEEKKDESNEDTEERKGELKGPSTSLRMRAAPVVPSSVNTPATSSRMRAGPVVQPTPKRANPPSPVNVKRHTTLDRFRAWMQLGPERAPTHCGVDASIGNDIPQPFASSAGGHGGQGIPPAMPARPRGLRDFEPADWPYQVAHLASNFNRTNIRFTRHEGIEKCFCEAPCRVHTCANATLGIFCTEVSCPFKGKCGNNDGRTELDGLRLMRIVGSDEMTLITRKPIDRGVVVGQYVGELSLVQTNSGLEPANEGYRLYMHRDDLHKRNERVCINALHGGSRMRFLNHSCDPAACFMEMSNGRERAVVVVTTRRIHADEELSVYYGDKLWFKCSCLVCRGAEAK